MVSPSQALNHPATGRNLISRKTPLKLQETSGVYLSLLVAGAPESHVLDVAQCHASVIPAPSFFQAPISALLAH